MFSVLALIQLIFDFACHDSSYMPNVKLSGGAVAESAGALSWVLRSTQLILKVFSIYRSNNTKHGISTIVRSQENLRSNALKRRYNA